ncbi:hypothetical protein GGR51DRAFT_538971 [Nemania sp. FL0031]|nr:hypothetical protein GGR51DRAFT_538971 [Nemania sp. FL0031]
MRTGLARIGHGLLPSEQAWSQTLSRATNTKPPQFYRLRTSPNRVLALRLRARNEDQKQRFRSAFRKIANIRGGRLPVLTFQALLATQDLSKEKSLAAAIAKKTPADWTDTFNSLAGKGWSKDQFDHWVWIVSGEDGDARVARFISTQDPKPLFLLFLLLRNDEMYREPKSLDLLIRYISKHYLTLPPPPTLSRSQPSPTRYPTVSQFIILLRRLIHHARDLHPPFVITVACLIVDYIKSIPNDPHHTRRTTSYVHQCIVYNTALIGFMRPSPNLPLTHMELNWRAQKILLAMSNDLKRPLIIEKRSYQAIRGVLVGLKKSRAERAVALRYAKSWPPYRQDFDGRDTKRTIEDDRSRSVKAGVLMKEAGYPDDDYDRALDALGGMSEGSPTIQTRSLPPKQWADEDEKLNVYSFWAMRVRATRNAQEAWRVFNAFAQTTGLAPNFQVYNEMFLKLQAFPVDPDSGSDPLPGDLRESFPVHDANYSQYEIARLSPPTVSELYTEMINRGIRPGGHGLHNLITHARSVEEGLRYLHDSGMPSETVESIAVFRRPPHSVLWKIPLLSFGSYIKLLCRLHPNRKGSEMISHYELQLIHHAIMLVSMRLTPDRTEGVTFRPPWHSILRALARNNIAIKNGPAVENDLEALALFMKTLQSARKCIGVDAELFMLLCRVIQKAARSRLISLPETAHVQAALVPDHQELLSLTTSIFTQLTTPAVEDMPTSVPVLQLQFPLVPPHLHAYMRALAFLEARDEMVNLVSWMMDNYEHVDEEANRTNRGHAMIAKTFCAFHAFAGPAMDEDVQKALVSRMDRLIAEGGHWRWPTAQEVESYVHSDARGGSQALRRKIILARAQRGDLRDEDRHFLEVGTCT